MLTPGNISARRLTIARVATALSGFLGRVVVDSTNLSGEFNLDLHWLPDQMPLAVPGVPLSPIDPTAPSLFTAVQEQLGLKLESSRGPVEILVIDSVEKPADD